MAEYSKQLHIRKDSTITDIKLYTTTDEVGTNYITLKDGTTPVYAKLGDTADTSASALRVRKASTVYAVLMQAAIPYACTDFTMPGSYSINIPAGVTEAKITIAGGGGGSGGFCLTPINLPYQFTASGGGAGGAGGYYKATVPVTAGTYNIIVGAGGNAGISRTGGSTYPKSDDGGNGGSSSFDSYTAAGGTGGIGGKAGTNDPQPNGVDGATNVPGTQGAIGGAAGNPSNPGGGGWVRVEYGGNGTETGGDIATSGSYTVHLSNNGSVSSLPANLTVPAGTTVIQVYHYVNDMDAYTFSVYGYLQNSTTGVYWAQQTTDGTAFTTTNYVAVTPGVTYPLTLGMVTDEHTTTTYVTYSWSSDINAITPTISDPM